MNCHARIGLREVWETKSKISAMQRDPTVKNEPEWPEANIIYRLHSFVYYQYENWMFGKSVVV